MYVARPYIITMTESRPICIYRYFNNNSNNVKYQSAQDDKVKTLSQFGRHATNTTK